jgi:cytochrome c oxidase subunit 3
MLFGWFGTVIRESEGGLFNDQVDMSFRWAMSWFIFSEVMFFAAFFGALFYARIYSVPWLGDLDNKLLWPDFAAHWPTAGPYRPPEFSPMGAAGIPAINTLLLLTSGVTVTWAHHALREGDRKGLLQGLGLTILLGLTFTGIQAYEYAHAAFGFRDGIYSSTFFMATGFHGAHVIIGTIFLAVCLFRAYRGHFKPDHHFGFEAAAWYWHFVDVVWLFLFTFIYVWAAGTPLAGH